MGMSSTSLCRNQLRLGFFEHKSSFPKGVNADNRSVDALFIALSLCSSCISDLNF